jgi:Rnl2 family RNA ligase
MEYKLSPYFNPHEPWVVTPKIDGSNMTIMFHSETAELYAARRSDILEEGEDFFNYQLILQEYGAVLKEIRHQVLADHSNAVDVAIHGEICGGYFPDMPVLQHAKKVQKSINYSNRNEFIVFDIRLQLSNGESQYLSHVDVCEYCKDRLPVVPILFMGTLDDCLSWSSKHNADLDETWKIFNMPHDGGPNNIREGHVIKPLHSIFKGDSRVIFKDKNAKFKDKDRNPKEPKEPQVYSDELNRLINEASSYINLNRFNSATSKIGEYTILNFEKIMIAIIEDILEELEDEYEYSQELSKEDTALLKKSIGKMVSRWMGANKASLF